MKLIVCDVDGTILDAPRQTAPSERFTAAIQSIKDEYLVACATGRSRSWAKPVLAAANFTAPCILGGGTHIVDAQSQEIIWELPLPSDALGAIKDTLRAHPEVNILFNDYAEEDYLNGGWPLEKLLQAEEVFLMEVVAIPEPLADELMARFRQQEGVGSIKMVSFHSGVVDIHVLNEGATKEHAIKRLQEMLGIAREDTIGIGDGHNDIHLFNAVGTKIAVENAVTELKSLADEVIGPVHEDAVANYLERLL